MTRTISDAERRAVKHENAAREALETADTALARAEREILELEESAIRKCLLATYAETRRFIDFARGLLG